MEREIEDVEHSSGEHISDVPNCPQIPAIHLGSVQLLKQLNDPPEHWSHVLVPGQSASS